MTRGVRGIVAILALLAGSVGDARQAAPLPDPEPFYAETRANLERAQKAQGDFAYRERRTELHLNPFGRLGTGATVVYDVTPLAGGGTERRLVERDGKAVADAQVERRQPRGRQTRRRSVVDDVVHVLRFTIDHRAVVAGRSTIAVRFEPKADVSAETREGGLAQRFAGTIFVDEESREVVRVEATATDDLTYGFGMVARLARGTTVHLARERVEENLWLPTNLRFSGSGRALLFRRLVIDQVIDWTNYRRVR
ncbi:MAG TPA: hypothetical protein VIY56_01810 [Vicinamibacterales bacterium]